MPSSLAGLEAAVDRIAGQSGFSGGWCGWTSTAGCGWLGPTVLAHRGHGIPNSVDSQLAIASGGKGLTALAVLSLVEEGRLDLGTSARSVLGCNGGYVVLALIAERAAGIPFADLVRQRVCGPAGMADTEFLRSDEPNARAALGYLGLEGLRTNVLHLPVRGNGDGGVYSTLADMSSLWSAFLGGRIVSSELVAEMVRPRSDVPEVSKRYGLGFWLHASGPAVMLEGMDAGVSFRSVHDPSRPAGHTVISNTTDGAWPLARYLDEVLLA